jgi:hypothetical protein
MQLRDSKVLHFEMIRNDVPFTFGGTT